MNHTAGHKASSSGMIAIVTAGLLVLIFCFVCFRATVQPIGHDEALTYAWFLDGGIYKILAFNPNNHFLFTALAKPSVYFLGLSELSLRAPTLIGTLVYLTAILFSV